jgi:hypothetical protein
MPLNRCMSSKGGERGRVALDESFRQDQVSIVTRLTPSGIRYVRSAPQLGFEPPSRLRHGSRHEDCRSRSSAVSRPNTVAPQTGSQGLRAKDDL